MAEATNEDSNPTTKNDQDNEKIELITVGRLVEVASRTWPGINKPGGVARVVQVHFDHDSNDENQTQANARQPTHVNVRYMVGSSREKRVPIEYVKLAPQYESTTVATSNNNNTSLRDRSMLLGRCLRCGSLRTDCGSCDWAMEEEDINFTTRTSSSKPPRRKRKNATLLNDDSDGGSSNSSSNEGDEDLAQLRTLIRRSKQRRRKQTSTGETSLNNSKTLETRRYSKFSRTWRKRYPLLVDDLSSSSSSDTSDSENESGAKGDLQRKSRRLKGRTSILESLGGNNKEQPKRRASSSKSTLKSKSLQQQATSSKSMESSSDSDSDLDDIPITSVLNSGKHKNNNNKRSKRTRSGEALVDIPLNTPNTTRRSAVPTDDDTHVHSYHQQLLELEARARFQIEQQQQQPPSNDIDAGFIQPEGQEAVENLPQDMVDLSKDVPYPELGPLFDSMARKLEDEVLPDYGLKLANLQHRLRKLQNQALNSDLASFQQLLEEYHLLWEEVRSSVIQKGTDQCQATLRRLLDDKLYKRYRKQLTAAERKKRPRMMDARNLRMDAMDEAVEAFVRRLKQAVVACETECEAPMDAGSDSNSDSFCENDVVSSESDGDGIPITAMVETEASETELAPFQPHQHATRVRKEPKDATEQSKKKTTKTTSSSQNARRKRPRTINFGQSKTKTSRRRKSRVNTNDAQGNDHNDRQSLEMSETEDPSSSRMEEGETELLSFDNSTGRRRKRTVRSRDTLQLGLAEPRDSKESISERMQAFLDANEANGMRIYSDGEEEETERVSNRRQRNYQRRHRRTYPMFEPRTRGNNESTVGDNVTINERGEMVVEEEPEESHFASYDTQSLFDQLSSGANRISVESTEILDDNEIQVIDKNWEGLLSDMEIALSNNPQSMNTFLQRIYHMLICRGSRTLQDLIASKDTELPLHIRTLSLCVRSLKCVSNEELPIPFSNEKQGFFLDLLVFQLVDALYSVSLPSAWALGIENRERIFQKLSPLRNALASQIPLVEAVSKCIIKSFGCQQWRKSQKKDHVFVSSLDPQCWSNFLETGTKFEDPQVTRFQKLGRVWPRIEADALWRILAFVGTAPSIATDKSIFRLQIVSKLFSSGILAVETVGKEEALPPSEDQLLACQQEIRYFSSLLRKGALDSLPKTDSMLVKLIQHSLNLQRDSFQGSSRARASCFPNSGDDALAKKASSMFWRITHPLSFNSSVENCRCVSIREFSFDQRHDKNDKTYKMLLYPTSNVLLSCTTLLINWINRVSTKKIRQNRLANSLKALQNELLKADNNRIEKSVENGDVTFENAFSVKPPIEVGTGSERAAIFKLEAASYIQIIASMCMKNQIDPDLSQTVWKNISDDEMKQKQCDIIGHLKNTDKYTGDAYRLFALAKIMATLLLIQMNISPWHLSLGVSVTRLFAENLQLNTESFSFPLSCIFACLDCLCDLEVGPHVFSQLYEIIILVFRNLSAMIVRGETSIASDHLRSNYVLNFNAVLKRCIRMHLASSVGVHECFHLRLCLSSIRAIQSFRVMHSHATNKTEGAVDESQNVVSDDNGDDMWGDLDDSDLAALDLAGISGGQNEAQQQHEDIWELLSDALEQSKPSKRFAILRNTDGMVSGSELYMSSIGKLLIAEEANKICDCLSIALASTQAESAGFFEVKKLLSKWSQPSYESDEDSLYLSQIERRLTSELCALAEKFPTCRTFVSENANNMLFNFLDALVDSSRLEKLPSCNLERIRESSGRVGTEQAMLMLDLFNDDSFQVVNDPQQGGALRRLQKRRRKSVTEIWEFCLKLGTAFSKNDSSDTASVAIVGNSLLNLDNDLLRKFSFSDDVISLENETFKTFRLLRNIVSFSAMNDTSFVVFESISSCVLILLANHVLSIVQSLKYNDQTSSDKEYKKAKLTELLASVVELFVSSAAWILQEGAKNRSRTWSFLQTYLRDRLFSPILRSQPIDATVALQEIIAAARFVQARPYSDSVALPAIHCVGLVGCSKYLGDCFFGSMLRRSKQLISATAFNPQNLGLQNAILEAVTGCCGDLEEAGPWLVGSTFPLGKRQCVTSRVVWPYSSPIQKQIDEYLRFVDENLASAKREDCDDWWNNMAVTKKSFLKNHVVPRLQSASAGMEKKQKTIMLLSHILENDKLSTCGVSDNPRERTLDIQVVREILKGLRSNLHKCMMQFSVNDELARAVVSCSIHLANSCLLLDEKEQNLVSWSRTKILGIQGRTMLDLTNSEVLGSYVWIFFQWLRTFGEMVINGNDSNLLSMRRHWKATQCCRLGGMDEERLDLEHDVNCFETLDKLLIDFEDLAMPSKSKSNKNIVVKNIYAKPQQQEELNDESLLLEPWRPSIPVKKNLKEVMAAILTTS